jgi:hypothetical protein
LRAVALYGVGTQNAASAISNTVGIGFRPKNYRMKSKRLAKSSRGKASKKIQKNSCLLFFNRIIEQRCGVSRDFQGFKPSVSSGRHESASKKNFTFLEK